MDFERPSEDDPRRREMRAWLAVRARPCGRERAEAGYAAPRRPGGLAADVDAELRLIIDEGMKRAGVIPPNLANPVAVDNCAQSLLTP